MGKTGPRWILSNLAGSGRGEGSRSWPQTASPSTLNGSSFLVSSSLLLLLLTSLSCSSFSLLPMLLCAFLLLMKWSMEPFAFFLSSPLSFNRVAAAVVVVVVRVWLEVVAFLLMLLSPPPLAEVVELVFIVVVFRVLVVVADVVAGVVVVGGKGSPPLHCALGSIRQAATERINKFLTLKFIEKSFLV